MGTNRIRVSATPLAQALDERPLGPVLGFMRSLWGVNHALESTSRRMKARIGVTGPERMALRLTGQYPGIAAGDLARILCVHPSTLTGLLKRLVRRGLLVRTTAADDARKALFTLTPRGGAIDKLRRGTVEAAVREALEALPVQDVQSATNVLDALVRAMSAAQLAGGSAPGARRRARTRARERRPSTARRGGQRAARAPR